MGSDEPPRAGATMPPLARAVEATVSAFWVVDREYRLIAHNSQFARQVHDLLGIDVHVGEPSVDALPGLLRHALVAHYRRALDGDSFSVEQWYAGRHFRNSFSPVLARDEISGVSVFSQDITEQTREGEALRASEAHFRATFDHAPIGVGLVSLDGCFLRVNRAFAELLSHTEEALVGAAVADVTHPEDIEADLAQMRKLVAGDISRYDLAKRYLRKDGRVVEAMVHVGLVRDAVGAPVHFIVQVEDMTVRNATQRALLEMERRMAHAERLATLGTLASGMAHEINNPLASVLANVGFVLELIDRAHVDTPQLAAIRDALVDANESAERVAKVIEGLRRFASAEGGIDAPLEIPSVVESALDVTEHVFGSHVTVERDFGPTPSVRANQAQLTQLFVNLLLHVSETIDRLAPNAKVRVVTRTDDAGRAIVEVHDTGRNHPTEDVQRDADASTRAFGHTGVELSVCRGMIQGLGGEIEVESAPGAGSTLRVSFPALLGELEPPASGAYLSDAAPPTAINSR